MKTVELRNAMNAKRPKFSVSNQHKRKCVSRSGWRAPRGMHNKERLHRFGKRHVVKVGYRGPKDARGLSREGLRPVMVFNLKDIAGVDSKTMCVIIAHVGVRRRLELLNACKEKGVSVMNLKVDAALSRIQKGVEDRRKKGEAVRKRRDTKKEAKPKKEVRKDSEEQKEEERKEMEKVLTRRE